MSVKVYWDSPEQTILVYEFEEGWTWDEFYIVYPQAKQMLASVPHIVNIILTYPSSTFYVPPNILSQIRKFYNAMSPNTGLVVVTGGSSIVSSVYNAVRRVYPFIARRCMLANNIHHARALLREHRRVS